MHQHSRESNPQHDTLVPYLLREVENEQGLCMDFLGEAVSRIEDDDTIAPLFTRAMVEISNKLSIMSMNDDYKPCVNVSCKSDPRTTSSLTLPGALNIFAVPTPS